MSEFEVSRTAPKKKKKERTGSFDAVMLRRAHGDEPSWVGVKITDEDYKMRIIQACNWANASFDAATFKRITIDGMTGVEEYAFLKEIPDYYFPAVGKQSWLRMNNAPTTVESDAFFKDCLEKLKIKYSEIKEEEKRLKEITQDISAKLSPEQSSALEYTAMYSFLDHLIMTHDLNADKVYDFIKSKPPTQLTLRTLLDHYKDNIKECDDYIKTEDVKGKEKKYISDLRLGSHSVVTLIEKILNNTRAENKLNKVRMPRKKKLKPAQMVVRDLKFKENDSVLKLVSIPPTAIISASNLVTYNTSSKAVTIYYAKNTDGLSVKGTTIQNFDSEKSKSKTLRKPADMLPQLTGTSVNRFEKVFIGIKSKEKTPNGRINDDTLLLKVFKT